jgi:hypothetical protein
MIDATTSPLPGNPPVSPPARTAYHDTAGWGGGEDPTLLTVVTALRRRWWLIVGLPLLVAVLSVATAKAPPTQYQARLSFAVDIPRSAIVIGSDEGTAAKIGEALIDDLSRMIGGDMFAYAVATHLPAGTRVNPGEIASSLSATDRHRIADVTVTRALSTSEAGGRLVGAGGQERDEVAQQLQGDLLAIAMAVVTELERNGNQWFARLGEDQVQLTIIDLPKVSALPPPLRTRLEIPLRVALALIVAVGLAVLWQVLDPRLYTDAEAAAMAGAPVVGHIPRHRRRRLSPRAGP